MHKLYCDRCGKEIKEKVGLLRHQVHYGKVKFDTIYFSPEEWVTWHEICPDCEDSFVRWYNHPEVNRQPIEGDTDGNSKR